MFFQHRQSVEKQMRKLATFTLRCMERPADPGKLHKVPHVAQLMCPAYAQIPLTLFEFELSITPSFCFIRNLRHRYNIRLKPSEADLYLFLRFVFEYIEGDMRKMYRKDRVVITSGLPHFVEVAAAAGFRVCVRGKDENNDSWRAIKWMSKI